MQLWLIKVQMVRGIVLVQQEVTNLAIVIIPNILYNEDSACSVGTRELDGARGATETQVPQDLHELPEIRPQTNRLKSLMQLEPPAAYTLLINFR